MDDRKTSFLLGPLVFFFLRVRTVSFRELTNHLHPPKINMKPKHHPVEKGNHLPNLHFLCSMWIFQGVQVLGWSSKLRQEIPLRCQLLNDPRFEVWSVRRLPDKVPNREISQRIKQKSDRDMGPKHEHKTNRLYIFGGQPSSFQLWCLDVVVVVVVFVVVGPKWLGGGFKEKNHPYLGKRSYLTNIFQMGWNNQPDD